MIILVYTRLRQFGVTLVCILRTNCKNKTFFATNCTSRTELLNYCNKMYKFAGTRGKNNIVNLTEILSFLPANLPEVLLQQFESMIPTLQKSKIRFSKYNLWQKISSMLTICSIFYIFYSFIK